MRNLAGTLLVALALALPATAAGSGPLVRIGGSLGLGYPQDEFRDNVDNTGTGGGVFMMIGSSDLPVGIGASVDFMQYGREEREAPWSITIPDVFVDVETTNDLVAAHLFLRLQPTEGFFQPYLEGLVGFHYLWTSTSVRDQGGDSEEIASTKHISDLVFSYGAGAGMMLEVWKPSGTIEPWEGLAPVEGSDEEVEEDDAEEGDEIGFGSIGVFLDTRYMRGREAEYLREGSITVDDGKVEYDVRRSRTDIVVLRIGFSLSFM